jgi:hypothetical protein
MVGMMIADSTHGHYSQSTSRAIVHVNAGDRVYLKNSNTNSDANYYVSSTEPYTTFTGTLVKAD